MMPLYVLASLGCTSKSVVLFHPFDAVHELIAQLVATYLLQLIFRLWSPSEKNRSKTNMVKQTKQLIHVWCQEMN